MQAVRHTPLAYRDALNHVSRSAYAQSRAVSHLPAHLARHVPRQVAATTAALWTNVKQHAALRTAGKTKKRDIGLDQAPKNVSSTPTYNDLRDDNFKPEQHLSLLPLQGRGIVPDSGKDSQVALIQQGLPWCPHRPAKAEPSSPPEQ